MKCKLINQILCGVSLVYFLCMVPTANYAKKDNDDVFIGKYRVLYSEILKEDRIILVYLPAGYLESNERYPVLYSIAGSEMHFSSRASTIYRQSDVGKAPAMIFIDIVDSHHLRDLLPVSLPGRPTTGHAANFRQFITKELIPFVEANYRTENFRILLGESNAGLFATDLFLSAPETFNAYIASSPMLGWCYDYIAKKTGELFHKRKELKKKLFIVYGNSDYNQVTDFLPKYKEFLETHAPRGLIWEIKLIINGDHVPFTSLYDGLNFIFPNWGFPRDLYEKEGIGAFENYYSKLSNDYGFKVKIPEEVMTDVGFKLFTRKKDWKSALKVFELLVKHYPDSFRAHYLLGSAYAKGKMKEDAIKQFKKVLELNPNFTRAAERLKQLTE
jgi:predicted alpha/beta superfamily hydrolase